MYKTKREILNQYRSLERSYEAILEMRGEIDLALRPGARFVFMGCGSSFYVAAGVAAMAYLYGAEKAVAVPAGDYMLNHARYGKLMEGACVVFLSRSGQTSEILQAAKILRENGKHAAIVSVCATHDAPMRAYADLNIEIPWAFDESVCQTQTVTNLYAAGLMLLAIRFGDGVLLEELRRVIDQGDAFLAGAQQAVEGIAAGAGWDNAVVLADGELQGMAQEGALAFTEICMIMARCFHVLDVRHGPTVLINERTLVVAACSQVEEAQQRTLLADLKARGATVVALSAQEGFAEVADVRLPLPRLHREALHGISLINTIQLIAFHKAIAQGINPDEPSGLDAWIAL